MSGVSFGSSASQKIVREEVISFACFVGLQECVTKVSPEVLRSLLAAYHAYLRKVGSGGEVSVASSSASSVVSARSQSSRLSVRSRGLVGSAKSFSALKTRLVRPVVTAGDEGYCYLGAVVKGSRERVAKEIGPRPDFFQLMRLSAADYDFSARLKLSHPVGGVSHLSETGPLDFDHVMSDVARRVMMRDVPGSIRSHYRANPVVGEVARLSPDVVVGAFPTDGRVGGIKWSFVSAEPGNVVLDLKSAGGVDYGIQLTLPVEAEYTGISRGGYTPETQKEFLSSANHWQAVEGHPITLQLEMKHGRVAKVLAGDMRP